MVFVIRPEIVARSLKRLREQQTHTLFPGYLHLQQRSAELKRHTDLQPDFVAFYKQFFRVGDHPLGTPYFKVFIDQKPSDANLWLNPNVAGSYAPSSLRPNQPFRRVVEIDSKRVYSLPEDHAERAFDALLYKERISAVDLAVVLYRDFGFANEELDALTLVKIFAHDFGYLNELDFNTNFGTLYHLESSQGWEKQWLQQVEGDSFELLENFAQLQISTRTINKVREMTADELLFVDVETDVPLQPVLKGLEVVNLLSFGTQTNFEFGQLSVLVGPNGSGKSNLIDCIRLLRYAPFGIQEAFSDGGYQEWVYKGASKNHDQSSVSVRLSIPGMGRDILHMLFFKLTVVGEASITEWLTPAELQNPIVDFYFWSAPGSPPELTGAGSGKRRRVRRMKPNEYDSSKSILSQIRDVSQYPEITNIATLYSQFRLYTEWTFGRNSSLRESTPTNRSSTSLSETMDDLALILNGLQNTEAHEKIRELLRELKASYADYITRILFGRVGLELIEEPFEKPVPAKRLSDGTLRFLALATILLQPTPPPLICLEEPELGMHPDMIRMVADMIVQARSRTQLIITTHSEMLLTALQDEVDVLFVFNAGENGSFVRRYSTEQFEVWREEHNLGELWTSGELGGNRW